jgi:hypothetical protein
MPPIRIDSNALIQRWRARRREILKGLPAELLAEYRQLGWCIKKMLAEEARFAQEQGATESTAPIGPPPHADPMMPPKSGRAEAPVQDAAPARPFTEQLTQALAHAEVPVQHAAPAIVPTGDLREVLGGDSWLQHPQRSLIIPQPRVRLRKSVSRQILINFLRANGPQTRQEITNKTAIPAGSLSELLAEPEFERHERGLWGLKGQTSPGTSAAPGSEQPT